MSEDDENGNCFALEFSTAALRDLRRLDSTVRKRVLAKLTTLAKEGSEPTTGPGIKALTRELAGLHRLRVGDVRVVYHVDGGELVVLVVLVGHRRDVYERAVRRLGK